MIFKITLMTLISSCVINAHAKNKRIHIAGEYIVKTSNTKIFNSFVTIKQSLGNSLYLIKTDNKATLGQFEKVYPNYHYIGNYIEEIKSEINVDDAEITKQVHHDIIGTKKAWNTTMGSREIIVAVTDNEFQINHPDLQNAWYKNPNEIPGNGIDDDNNGYVDDVYGWDFVNQDNNVNAYDGSHGTHVSGIIAAEANNGQGGAGVAPNVKLMPLRWYGYTSTWTSAIVAETYMYAVNNGAKIISTSYGIDSFIDDELYLDTVKYVRSKGVLIFNSAGNINEMNPPRQAIEDVILVCATTSLNLATSDLKASFSNYGTGIDICAPGDPVYSTVRRLSRNSPAKYANKSGTSMATPVVAGVAALIWSANPNFTDEEVKKKLFESADSIDEINPSFRGMLGAGRVNAAKAVK